MTGSMWPRIVQLINVPNHVYKYLIVYYILRERNDFS
jgi:hypothetical protein